MASMTQEAGTAANAVKEVTALNLDVRARTVTDRAVPTLSSAGQIMAINWNPDEGNFKEIALSIAWALPVDKLDTLPWNMSGGGQLKADCSFSTQHTVGAGKLDFEYSSSTERISNRNAGSVRYAVLVKHHVEQAPESTVRKLSAHQLKTRVTGRHGHTCCTTVYFTQVWKKKSKVLIAATLAAIKENE